MSARGLAGCGSIDLAVTSISGGAGVRFNPAILAGPIGILSNVRLFAGCDLSSFRTVVPPARAAQVGSRTVEVAAGTPLLALSAEGAGAAPRVVLRGPDGTVVDLSGEAGSVKQGAFLGLRAEAEDRTLFLVAEPAAGRWTVTGDGVVRLQRAGRLAPIAVSARVTGKGPRRVLRYRVPRRSGQVVRFAEEADGGGQLLRAVTGGGRGRQRFVVADARGTSRRIVAQVSQDGLPRDNVVVARFSAPSPRVGRVRRLRVTRKGRVGWRAAPFATGYEAVVTLRTGARRLVALGRRKRTLTVRGLRRVTVTALGANGRRGPAASAAPRKRKRR